LEGAILKAHADEIKRRKCERVQFGLTASDWTWQNGTAGKTRLAAALPPSVRKGSAFPAALFYTEREARLKK